MKLIAILYGFSLVEVVSPKLFHQPFPLMSPYSVNVCPRHNNIKEIGALDGSTVLGGYLKIPLIA